MITITGTLSKGWMHRAIDAVFDRDYYFDPAKRHATDCRCNEYAAKTFPNMGVFYSESNLGQIKYWDRNQVLIGGIQPNMILGLLLGADFIPADDRDADITPCCLQEVGWALAHADHSGVPPGLKSILPDPETLLSHDLVRGFDGQIRDQARKGLRAIPPFFWDSSGRAVIHGVLTTAQKLCGESIFLDMLTEPTRCMRLLDWIADAYIVLCRHFAEVANLPITEVHVGECSCCMVSPRLVEEFVVPVTSRIGAALGLVRFHSCGTSTHLLSALARIDGLHSLDFGSETSLGKAREIFGRQMPITIAPAPHDMSAEGTATIVDWARRALAENASGNLGFVYHLEPSYNIQTIYALTDFVRQHQTGGSTDG